MSEGYSIDTIRTWLRQESDRLDWTYKGIRATGGSVRGRPIAGCIVITGVDFETERNGTKSVIHTKSNGIMKPVTVTGFSGIDEEPVSCYQDAFQKRVVGVFRRMEDDGA